MDPHSDLDEQTARLIVQVQIDDIEEASSNAKGRSSHGAPDHNDFACALAIFGNDLKAVFDHGMARRIALADEHLASGIRNTAPAFPVMTDVAVVNHYAAIDEDMGDDEVDSTYEEDIIYIDDEMPGHAATRPVDSLERQCCACRTDFFRWNVARAPCGHEYCYSCLERLFTLSLTDQALFPPSCCSEPIPAEENRMFLTPQLFREFQDRRVEMETVDRTYCHNRACSKFIPPRNLQHQIGRCVACNAQTCSVCKMAAHVGDCPADPATRALEITAAQNGWKRCNNCRRIVELASGCNHITCPCGSEFCYLCGEAWKTCNCVRFTEQQLFPRANIFAARNLVAGREVDRPQIRWPLR